MTEKIELYYIEKKTGTNHNGLAWIGYVKKSRTGKTVYFNNKAYQKYGHGDYTDIETGDGYWISRIKRNGEDRHWAGSGMIMIDRNAVDEYLKYRGLAKLKESKYMIVDIIETKQPIDFYNISE
ncbi:MAG: hypothetical protein LBT56_04670 [Prevotellaceae bacterium]|jgi:hypothetical protein|nr:hypothetical protein [Prevotellaceae bacterium]